MSAAPESATDDDALVGAILRALAASDHTGAIALAERHWGYLVSFRLGVLRAVVDALPDDFLQARPTFAVLRQLLLHTFLGPLRPTVYADTIPPLTADMPLLDHVVVHTARSAIARSVGRVSDAIAWADRARIELATASCEERAAAEHAMSELHEHWGLTFLFAGREREAIALFEQSYEWAERLGNPRGAVAAAGELAWLDAHAGRSDAARARLRRVRALIDENPGMHPTRGSHLLAEAILHVDALEIREAHAALEAMDDPGEHSLLRVAIRGLVSGYDPERDPSTVAAELLADVSAHHEGFAQAPLNLRMLGAAQARLHVRAGHPEWALRVLQRGERNGSSAATDGRTAPVLYLLGEHDRAYALTSQVLGDVEAPPRACVFALAVRAAIELHRGETALATDTFSQALELVVRYGLVVGFATLPPEDLRGLAALLPSDGRVAILDGLLDGLMAVPAVPQVPRLTRRERAVLATLATGATLPQAATRLSVSVNTVKTQLRSLHRKLGVHDRQQLIVAARRRGLL
ncbi:LuxR C-terminal-related transcriptional regulator [Microbacterium album]|uniref:HTH luxR-type domain-containing protein n=1 Tax=Microbacterium album TaxID=2053191 RepID=A0A917IDB1_9MICO|nr:LuxR C-terminal-related transcriptional regulator [Microbacterium album]GGH34372.1 hypothetical protein GCM10010921_02030 [Microbacterium album]